MALVYKSICMELDELIIQIVHLSEKLVKYKLEVEKVMNSGFFNIAKARYIMGSKCVSTLQLPTMNSNRVHALATVCRIAHDGYWSFKTSRQKVSPVPSDEKLLEEKIENQTKSADFIKDLLEKDSTNIRKRKEFFLVKDGNYGDLNEDLQDEVTTDSSESGDSCTSITDPIRLFGVLVPYTLRIAQKNFQDVIDIILHCATIQSQTEGVLKRYYHLLKVKRMIESAADERDLNLSEEREYWTSSENISQLLSDITEDFSDLSLSGDHKIEECVKNMDYNRKEFEGEYELELGEKIFVSSDIPENDNTTEYNTDFKSENSNSSSLK